MQPPLDLICDLVEVLLFFSPHNLPDILSLWLHMVSQ